MGISVKEGAAIHDPASFEIICKVCTSYYPANARLAIRVQFTAWPGYYINADGIGLRLARTLFTP